MELIAISKLTSNKDKLIKEFTSQLDNKEKTIEDYVRGVNIFFRWLEDNDIKSITEETLINYKKDLLTKKHLDIYGNLKEPYSAGSTNAYIIALKQFFDFLERKYNLPNYAKRLKKESTSDEFTKDALTIDQVKSIFDSLQNDTEEHARDNAIFKLMVLTGLREIEVIRADIKDKTNKGKNNILKIQGKGKFDKDEFVILYSVVNRAIQDYLKFRPKAKGSEPLFTSLSNRNKGARLTTRSIQKIVTNILLSNGIVSDRITTHSLRHTAVTLSILNGASIFEAQKMARHKDINITMRYFNDLNRFTSNAEMKLNELFKKYE